MIGVQVVIGSGTKYHDGQTRDTCMYGLRTILNQLARVEQTTLPISNLYATIAISQNVMVETRGLHNLKQVHFSETN